MGLALAAQKVITALRPHSDNRRCLERLLVVDDERMACSMLALRLRQSGFEVETAHSGSEAIEFLNARTFDLVLLDRLMPGWSGDRVLQEIRQSHSALDLPVIMVSALDDSEQVAEALEMGANDYITKPIDFTVAVARIRSQLVRGRSEHADRKASERAEPASQPDGDGLWDWNLDSNLINYCPRWAAMLGLTRAQVSNEPSSWFARVHPEDVGSLREALDDHRSGKSDVFEMDYRIRCKDGEYRWMAGRGVAFCDAAGRAVRIAGTQTDITVKKTTDAVTGLPNRTLFMERLRSALETKRLKPGHGLAVLVINVDRFNMVNDSLGHLAGDHLLVEFGNRIRSVVNKWRSAAEDREDSFVARLGGDKFAAVMDGISSPLQAVSIADHMLQALRPMVVLGAETGQEERSFRFTASIGVAISRERYQAAEEILKDADAAMCSATAQEKDCWALFSESMRSHSTD